MSTPDVFRHPEDVRVAAGRKSVPRRYTLTGLSDLGIKLSQAEFGSICFSFARLLGVQAISMMCRAIATDQRDGNHPDR
jgi:hypothetical protein